MTTMEPTPDANEPTAQPTPGRLPFGWSARRFTVVAIAAGMALFGGALAFAILRDSGSVTVTVRSCEHARAVVDWADYTVDIRNDRPNDGNVRVTVTAHDGNVRVGEETVSVFVRSGETARHSGQFIVASARFDCMARPA